MNRFRTRIGVSQSIRPMVMSDSVKQLSLRFRNMVSARVESHHGIGLRAHCAGVPEGTRGSYERGMS
jgi:hypothetical protein